MAEATIDELQIEISTTSGSAADNLEKLAQKLEHLNVVVQPLTANSGLEKAAKQLDKLSAVSQRISGLSGFEKIGQAVDNLKKIEQLNNIRDISPFIRNLNKIPQIVTAISQMPSVDATKFQQLADAFKPLSSINSSGINSLVNSLRKIPKLSQELAAVDFSAFSRQIQQIAQSIEPLARQAQSAGAGLQAIAQIMHATGQQAQQSSGGVSLFNTAIGNIKAKTLQAVAALRRLFSALKNGITASAAYVENLTLFKVTMGESADEALRFAEAVTAALGVDTSDWIRYQGFFQSIGKGFGIASEQSDLMSKNLTQLSYDLSSFFNTSVDEAYTKLQSGFAGEMEPLRSLGFALDETTLKQLAFNKGIKTSFENMTQAQKAQLRYVAIMEQAGNIGVLGDMARTIGTASNGMRVLEARIQQFSRAVGNMLMPMLSAVLPYATAFVQVLTEGAQAIADLFGFELPKIDFSGASVSTGYDDITSSIDNATEASEKFKGSLASIDQLNIIGSETENKTAAAGNQFDLGIELPEYDFLQGVESKTKQIADDIKNWFKEALPWIEAVGAGIGAVFVTTKVKDFLGFLGQVKDVIFTIGNAIKGKFGTSVQTFSGIAGGLAAGAASGTLFYNSIKNLITGTGKLGGNIAMLGGGVAVAGGAIATFIALGNPVGAVITGLTAAFGAVMGVIKGVDENITKLNKEMTDSVLFNNGGTKISEVADAFGEWAETAESVNRQTIDKYSQLDEYNTKIDSVLSTMQQIAGVDINPTALTPEEAENLRKPFSDLCGYLETDFKQRTQTVANDLKGIFTNLGLGEVVSSEIGQAYADMQELFSRNLTQSQTVVDNYLKQIASGGTLTEAQQLEFGKEYNKVLRYSRANDESYMDVQKAITAFSDLDLSKIDFETDETAQKALQDVLDSATSYQDSALERYKAEMDNLLELKIQANTAYELGDLTESQYKSQLDLIDFSEAVFAENLNSELNEVIGNVEKVLSPIDSQLYDAAQLVKPTLTQIEASKTSALWTGHWFDFLDYTSNTAQEVAKGQWYENNPTWQKTQELKDFVSQTQTLKIETELPIDNQYSDTYELVKKAMKGEKFDLNLVPKIAEPVDNEKIYKETMKTIEAETKVDWSNSTPTATDNGESTNTGYAREAYEQATQQSPSTNSFDTIEATVPINVNVWLDNDLLMEKFSEEQTTLNYRNNGKAMW